MKQRLSYIQASIHAGKYSLVWSYMLDFENNDNPYEEKTRTIEPWKHIAEFYQSSLNDIFALGQKIMKQGVKPKDALHIACTIYSGCDYFITTDKGLLNKNISKINIVTPIEFVTERVDF